MGNKASKRKTYILLDNYSHVKGFETGSKWKQVTLTIKKLKSHNRWGGKLIENFLAVKNEDSYMIGNTKKGLKLFEDRVEVFARAWTEGLKLFDIIYINHQNCYLLCTNEALYRKDIDDKPPYAILTLNYYDWAQIKVRYSQKSKRLITTRDPKKISVVNLARKQREMEVNKPQGGYIIDFRLFGKNDEKIVSITIDGYVYLHILKYDSRKLCACNHLKLELHEKEREQALSIAVCDKGKYALIELDGSNDLGVTIRLLVVKIDFNQITNTAIFEPGIQHPSSIRALECCGYLREQIVWLALTESDLSVAQIYQYNTITSALAQRQQLRMMNKESFPQRVQRIGNSFFYTGAKGSLMKLTIEAKEAPYIG